MIERELALRALSSAGCSGQVIQHCLTVERGALEIAQKIKANHHTIDLNLVSVGALLHDIGRAKTHGIRHGVIGGQTLREIGLGEFARFAENHLGAGIPAGEAKALGLPARDFVPRTLEEKVVTYADKLTTGSHTTSYAGALEWFKSELGPEHPAIERFKKLHLEIEKLSAK